MITSLRALPLTITTAATNAIEPATLDKIKENTANIALDVFVNNPNTIALATADGVLYFSPIGAAAGFGVGYAAAQAGVINLGPAGDAVGATYRESTLGKVAVIGGAALAMGAGVATVGTVPTALVVGGIVGAYVGSKVHQQTGAASNTTQTQIVPATTVKPPVDNVKKEVSDQIKEKVTNVTLDVLVNNPDAIALLTADGILYCSPIASNAGFGIGYAAAQAGFVDLRSAGDTVGATYREGTLGKVAVVSAAALAIGTGFATVGTVPTAIAFGCVAGAYVGSKIHPSSTPTTTAAAA